MSNLEDNTTAAVVSRSDSGGRGVARHTSSLSGEGLTGGLVGPSVNTATAGRGASRGAASLTSEGLRGEVAGPSSVAATDAGDDLSATKLAERVLRGDVEYLVPATDVALPESSPSPPKPPRGARKRGRETPIFSEGEGSAVVSSIGRSKRSGPIRLGSDDENWLPGSAAGEHIVISDEDSGGPVRSLGLCGC